MQTSLKIEGIEHAPPTTIVVCAGYVRIEFQPSVRRNVRRNEKGLYVEVLVFDAERQDWRVDRTEPFKGEGEFPFDGTMAIAPDPPAAPVPSDESPAR